MQDPFDPSMAPPDSPIARWLDLFSRSGFTVEEIGRPAGLTWAAMLRSSHRADTRLTVFRSVSRPELNGRPTVDGLHRDALSFLVAQSGPVAWLPIEPEGGGVVMHFPRHGAECAFYPIVGWALGRDFQRGPVVASANAPAPCVCEADATNWYARTTSQEIGA